MALTQVAPMADARDAQRILAAALAQNRIVLAYQPVISARLGDVPAFTECLARIKSGDGSISSAGALIAAVETTDLGRVLDRAILRKVLATLLSCPNRRLSVNLSAASVGDAEWLALLREANARTPGIADWLVVEITETASLTLDAAALDFLYEVRQLGVSLALDDFGAGHTSLKQLGKFRFDFLKIDRSLCVDLTGNPGKQRTLASVLRIAGHFDMVTVAEGIETVADADILVAAGVDCLQGYLYGMPQTDPDWLALAVAPEMADAGTPLSAG